MYKRQVVYTAAIHPDNPELKAAVDAGIPTLTRAELLGQIMKNYHTAVNVAGTHGKTTTTSMITEILLAADADPTISVGGILNSIGGNIRVGRSDLFVTEACEYTNSFLSFNPTINIIPVSYTHLSVTNVCIGCLSTGGSSRTLISLIPTRLI